MKLFSSDSHVNEPPECWERLPQKLRSKGPRFIQDPGRLKGLYLWMDGISPQPVGLLFTAGRDRRNFSMVIETFQWESWRGPWDARSRPADMDMDGVQAEVLYPSTARLFYSVRDPALRVAGLAAYNSWLADYCAKVPGRLFGLGMLSALDTEWSIKELDCCQRLGFKGVILPSLPPGESHYGDREFTPLWRALQDSGMPVHFHVHILPEQETMTVNQLLRYVGGGGSWLAEDLTPVQRTYHLRRVLAEYELEAVRRFADPFYVTFDSGEVDGDYFMWANDYPHAGSTWPNSRKAVEGMPESLTWGNAASFYGIE